MKKLNENTVKELVNRDIIQDEEGKIYIIEDKSVAMVKMVEITEGIVTKCDKKHLIGNTYIGRLDDALAFGYNF
ncbi:hypothetical protein [Staphylococcus aureus]|uniref:hypothetical protein n=1 Tax=Staphylococcus aureus TaxID=1280 RepID=UPI00045281E8|nr:hypothetical protein [Staphylococcus aureus]EZX75038.1 hypothetical protein V110_02628 [Staphylococcus aureus Chi-8]HEO8820571.1 hypothetical protein [Staphylococcus aureus]